jgi:hypothetical protein
MPAPKKKETVRDSLLSSERAALGQSGLSSRRLAEHSCASLADDDGLGVGEDGGDREAAGALDVHKEGPRSRHKKLRVASVSFTVQSYGSDLCVAIVP